VSREEPRLAKVIDIRSWREAKARQVETAPPPAPPPPERRPRGLALTLGVACCVLGLGLIYLPFWVLARGLVSRLSLGLLFGIVLPAGLGLGFLGVDLLIRTWSGRAGEGWYLRRVGLRRRAPLAPGGGGGGGEPSRFGKRPHEL